ncbi:MAG: hypothetical protein ACTHM8_13360 [Sphingomonas sp.]
MLAVGCLAPVLLMIGGALLGGQVGGTSGSIWGCLAGLTLGLIVPAIMLGALFSARRKS